MEILELLRPADLAWGLLAFIWDGNLTCDPNWQSVDACTVNLQELSRFRIGYQAVYKLATCSSALRESIRVAIPEGFETYQANANASFRVCPALLHLSLAQAQCWEFAMDANRNWQPFQVWCDIRDKLAALPLLLVPVVATRPADCMWDETWTRILGLPLLLRSDRLRMTALSSDASSFRVLDARFYDDGKDADCGFVQVEGTIRDTIDEILLGFAMPPELICEQVKYRLTLAANDVGDGGIGYLHVDARSLFSPARYSVSFLCLVCGYHPCYGHDQIRTTLGSDDAHWKDASSSEIDQIHRLRSQRVVHVHPAALVSWDAVWDFVLEGNKHSTDMVRISSQKRALQYEAKIAFAQLREEVLMNPELACMLVAFLSDHRSWPRRP